MTVPVTPDGLNLLVNLLSDIAKIQRAATDAEGVTCVVDLDLRDGKVCVAFGAEMDLGLEVSDGEPAL